MFTELNFIWLINVKFVKHNFFFRFNFLVATHWYFTDTIRLCLLLNRPHFD